MIDLLLPPQNQPYFTNNFYCHFFPGGYYRSAPQSSDKRVKLWQRLDNLIEGRDIQEETKRLTTDWEKERIVYYPLYITLKREGFEHLKA